MDLGTPWQVEPHKGTPLIVTVDVDMTHLTVVFKLNKIIVGQVRMTLNDTERKLLCPAVILYLEDQSMTFID